MNMELGINSLKIVILVHVKCITFDFSKKKKIIHLVTCYSLSLYLNTQSPARGAVWGGCRTFGFCGSASRSESLEPCLKGYVYF